MLHLARTETLHHFHEAIELKRLVWGVATGHHLQSGFTWAKQKAGDLPGDEGGSNERWAHGISGLQRSGRGSPSCSRMVYGVDVRIGVLKHHVRYTQAEYLSALKCVVPRTEPQHNMSLINISLPG